MQKSIIILGLLLMAILPLPTAQATHDPNDFFVTEATFAGRGITAIHGSSAADIWAISTVTGGGTDLLRNTGGGWSLHTHLTMAGTVNIGRSIWTVSPTLAYATAQDNGEGFTGNDIAIWNGAVWTQFDQAPGDTTFAAPHALTTGNGWVMRSGQQVCPLSAVGIGTCQTLGTLAPGTITQTNEAHTFGFATNDYFAVFKIRTGAGTDLGTQLWHYDGTAWSLSTTVPPGPIFTDIWGTSATNLFFTADGTIATGTIWKWDGSTLVPMQTPQTSVLQTLWGVSATDIWAAGDTIDFEETGQAQIIHYDGTTWTVEPNTRTTDIDGLYCSASQICWNVGVSTIQKLQVNPGVALPGIAIAEVHEEDTFEATVSEGQCLGDETSFNYNLELGSALITVSDLDAYIIDQDNPGTTFIQVDDSAMNTIGSRAFFHGEILPHGPYIVLVKVDLSGLGAADYWDAEAFTVQNACAIDGPDPYSPIILNHVQYNQAQENTTQLHLNYTDNNVTHLHNEIHDLVMPRINATFVHTNNLLNNIFGRLNTTCQKTPSADGCESITFECLGCNVTVNNTEVLTELNTLDTEIAGGINEFSLIVILALLFLWAEIRKKMIFYIVAFIACVLAALILDGLSWARIIIIAAGLLALARGFAVEEGEKEDNES